MKGLVKRDVLILKIFFLVVMMSSIRAIIGLVDNLNLEIE